MPYHERYTWQVHTVELDKAQETLDGITLETHEVYATHLVPGFGEQAPRLMIIARQHYDVHKALADDKTDAQARQAAEHKTPMFRMWGRAPSNGVYKSQCSHAIEFEAGRGETLPPCGQCKKEVQWALIKPHPPTPRHLPTVKSW